MGASQSGLMGMELPQGWDPTQRHPCSPCARGAEMTAVRSWRRNGRTKGGREEGKEEIPAERLEQGGEGAAGGGGAAAAASVY